MCTMLYAPFTKLADTTLRHIQMPSNSARGPSLIVADGQSFLAGSGQSACITEAASMQTSQLRLVP